MHTYTYYQVCVNSAEQHSSGAPSIKYAGEEKKNENTLVSQLDTEGKNKEKEMRVQGRAGRPVGEDQGAGGGGLTKWGGGGAWRSWWGERGGRGHRRGRCAGRYC
jgi:hypothetical protein